MSAVTLEDCLSRLDSPEAEGRLEALRQLRELGDPAAGPKLVACLELAMASGQDWLFVHGLIGALGQVGYGPALGFLEGLLEAQSLGAEPREALGFALVRLSCKGTQDLERVFELVGRGDQRVAQGALEAMARLRLVPCEEDMERLVGIAMQLELSTWAWSLIWILRAAPGWGGEAKGRLVEHFSSEAFLQLRQVHQAALLAQKGEYRDWAQF